MPYEGKPKERNTCNIYHLNGTLRVQGNAIMSIQHDQPSFRTADLTLAQLLVAHGYTPQVQSLDGRLCSFQFISDPELTDLTTAYHAGEATVEPQRLLAAERRLRTLMDQARNGGAS